MTEQWDEGTFAGAAAARNRRLARLTPQQRLEWLEEALREADRAGVLDRVRRMRQREALKAWATLPPGGR